MELTFYQGGDSPEFVRVKKILKDANFRPIEIVNNNPIMNSWMYEVEYNYGHPTSLEANLIATCVRSLVKTQGISTNRIPINQVSRDIRNQAW